ncbi:MAG: phosphoglycolate phosphatase [Gammaproteobacteria bacterium]|nr:phosphoglycolate phosphatase [Gammaproteobacteria bacterium]MYF37407.1 phosphoglycolate phosphatase [Gammaproteobacteria bacterium]
MTDTFLFDLDGTLVDTAPDLHDALNFALSTVKLGPVDIALTRHWVGHGAKKMISSALEQHNERSSTNDLVEKLYEDFLVYYRRHIAILSKPFTGVRLTVQHMSRQRYKLGVVTNKRYDLSTLLLKKLDLFSYFGVVVGGDTLSVAKPNPDPILHACSALDTRPTNVVFVGDSTTDVSCARAAGCPVVLVPYGYNQGVSVSTLGADRTIESLVDLI